MKQMWSKTVIVPVICLGLIMGVLAVLFTVNR
jgi:hypothetical protein